MLSNWWIDGLTWLEVAAELCVLVLAWQRRLLRSWPSVITSCAVSLCACPILFAMTGKPDLYRWYFYSYWALIAVQAALRLWILTDIVQHLPGVELVSKGARGVLAIVGVVMAVFAWLVTWHDGTQFKSIYLATVVLFDRCVNISTAALMTAILGSIIVLRLTWRTRGSLIAWGMGLQVVSKVIVSICFSFASSQVRVVANDIEALSSVLVLAIWIYAFTIKESILPKSGGIRIESLLLSLSTGVQKRRIDA